jgi:antitoxin (DNA-binding transcriptional repressor) of toxin-antitoxin stability system
MRVLASDPAPPIEADFGPESGVEATRARLPLEGKPLYIFTYGNTYSRFWGMRLDSNRLISATEARTTLPSLLDAAREGHITHILRDRTVAAHLVPGDALIITGDIEPDLRTHVARTTAGYFVDDIESSGYRHPGDDIGRILAWVWACQEDAAVAWFGTYAAAVAEQLKERRIARPAFDQLWWAMTVALRGFMLDGPIADYEQAIRHRLHDLGYGQLFTPSELAGHGRQRGADDPWPDGQPSGRGWAKRRWQDITTTNFVPDPRLGHTYGTPDDWSRVEAIAPNEATLLHNDGTQSTIAINPDEWVPFHTTAPWRWGPDSGLHETSRGH